MQDRFWLRIAMPFLLFIAAGTIGLLLLLNVTYQQRSRIQFASLAAANAEFIRAAHIPPTERFAGYLSQVLGVEVYFRRVPAPDQDHEAVTVPVEPGTDITLIRERPTLRALLLRPTTIGAVAVLWGLSLALAVAVVRPYLESQRLAMLGQMATALAHEVQNPVAAIRLHAQLLNAGPIVAEAATIESLVNQWMFLAKPEPPQKSTVALAALLNEIVQAMTPQAEHARVKLVVETAPGQTLEADRRRLAQVFRNLILNAFQAMPEGGTLTIRARDRRVIFADTGPGFSTAALARCPEMFFTEKEGGMGIGLAVANEIIQAHGGRLVLANCSAGGAQVTVEL